MFGPNELGFARGSSRPTQAYAGAAIVALLAFTALTPGLSRSAAAQSSPIHPAIVRVMATEGRGVSFGSGALVAVNRRYGLVLTNWHVVRDTDGFILVSFPDGFRSPATVVQVDRDWDLAALAVWRPAAMPLRIADAPPQLGEWLTIAGYGRGQFRMAAGPCTQYVSPGKNLPFEMIEVATSARQGDSGGPILNSRGELVGVLFGTGMGRTMGSYCGRIRQFVAPLLIQMEQMDRYDEAMAATQSRQSEAFGIVQGNLTADGTVSNPLGAASNAIVVPPQGAIAASSWEGSGQEISERAGLTSGTAPDNAPRSATVWTGANRGPARLSPMEQAGSMVGGEAMAWPEREPPLPDESTNRPDERDMIAHRRIGAAPPLPNSPQPFAGASVSNDVRQADFYSATTTSTTRNIKEDSSRGVPEVSLGGAAPPAVSLSPVVDPAAPLIDRLSTIQTFLAFAGAVLLTYHALRLIGRAVG